MLRDEDKPAAREHFRTPLVFARASAGALGLLIWVTWRQAHALSLGDVHGTRFEFECYDPGGVRRGGGRAAVARVQPVCGLPLRLWRTGPRTANIS